MFLNSPKPKLLVLLGHLNEMGQSLPEFGWPFARAIDEADANALIGI